MKSHQQIICIMLPTYNEVKTIATLIDSLISTSKQLPHCQMHVLVVDDNSSDGTADIVKNKQREFPFLYLTQDEKQGLGKAYLRGLLWVLDNLPRVEHVLIMDADLSHDPKYIADFLHFAHEGYDFIIGSRYVEGGDCLGWNWQRKTLSYWGNQYIRFASRVPSVHDWTSGYRCISTDLLKKIDFQQLLITGYAFNMSFLYKAIKEGARIKELPIVFVNRKEGESKLKWNDVIEYFLTATSLYSRN